MYQLKLSVLCDLTAGDTLHPAPGSRSKWKLRLDKIAHCHTADAIHITCLAKSENFHCQQPPTPTPKSNR